MAQKMAQMAPQYIHTFRCMHACACMHMHAQVAKKAKSVGVELKLRQEFPFYNVINLPEILAMGSSDRNQLLDGQQAVSFWPKQLAFKECLDFSLKSLDFLQTSREYAIESFGWLANYMLYRDFDLAHGDLIGRGRSPQIILGYHGSAPNACEMICTEGFCAFCSSVFVYGRGIYMSPDLPYVMSDRYSKVINGKKTILLVAMIYTSTGWKEGSQDSKPQLMSDGFVNDTWVAYKRNHGVLGPKNANILAATGPSGPRRILPFACVTLTKGVKLQWNDWTEFGSMEYVGPVDTQNRPHGNGKVTYNDPADPRDSCEAKFVSGSMLRINSMVYSNGSSYTLPSQDGDTVTRKVQNMRLTRQLEYTGTLVHGIPDGRIASAVITTSSDPITFKGEFDKMAKPLRGTFTYDPNTKMEGWFNSKNATITVDGGYEAGGATYTGPVTGGLPSGGGMFKTGTAGGTSLSVNLKLIEAQGWDFRNRRPNWTKILGGSDINE